MKKINKVVSNILLAGIAVGIFAGCERRPLVDHYESESADIPVKIDWSQSGVDEPNTHRASLRFFPKDGSPAFDRYLETNVKTGSVKVPIGNYSVVVFNESHIDTYWNGKINFSDVNSYSDFAANIVTDKASNHANYTQVDGETLIVEPLAISSWSLDNFVINEEIVKWINNKDYALSETDKATVNALSNIVMRRLTYNVTVNAKTENLGSVQSMQGALRGIARKVYLASGKNADLASTYVFRFGSRLWDDAEEVNGTATKTFLSFGKQEAATAEYALNIDAVFVNGALHEDPLLFDVTGQLAAQTGTSYVIDVSLQLPKVTGDITVDPWEDEETIIE